MISKIWDFWFDSFVLICKKIFYHSLNCKTSPKTKSINSSKTFAYHFPKDTISKIKFSVQKQLQNIQQLVTFYFVLEIWTKNVDPLDSQSDVRNAAPSLYL